MAPVQKWLEQGRPLPQREGPASILTIVNQRLAAAGLRKLHKPPNATAGTPNATAPVDAIVGPDETPRPWAPIAHVPYNDLQKHRGRSARGWTPGAPPPPLGKRVRPAHIAHRHRTPQVRGRCYTTLRGTARYLEDCKLQSHSDISVPAP